MLKINLKIEIFTVLICMLFSVCYADQGSTKKPVEESSKTPEVIESISKDLSNTAGKIFKTFTGAFKAVKKSFDKDDKSGKSQKKLGAKPESKPAPSHTEDKKELEAKYQPLKMDNIKESETIFEESDDLESLFEDDSDVIFETKE